MVILGAGGQLGQELVRLFPESVAVTRSLCDIAKPAELRGLLRRTNPSCLINASAYTNVDEAENDPGSAYSVNALAPAVLADYAALHHIPLVHYSTDFVFSGDKTEPYVEIDPTGPVNVYGRSKVAGERALIARCEEAGNIYYVLRTSWLYGPTRWEGGNFIKTILRLAKSRDRLRVVSDQFGVPTSARWLASITQDLVSRSQSPGVYHAVPCGEATWHNLAVFSVSEAKRCGMAVQVLPGDVEPIATAELARPARRPANSRLDNTKLLKVLGRRSFPTWQAQVADYIAKLGGEDI